VWEQIEDWSLDDQQAEEPGSWEDWVSSWA
jgi:hypothetical protein